MQAERLLQKMRGDAVPALAKALSRKPTCMSASRILSQIGHPAVPALIRALGNDEAATWAELALHRLKKQAVPGLIEGLNDRNRLIRARAASLLGRIGAEAQSAVKPLERLLNDEDDFVRFSAEYALKQIRTATGKSE